MTITNSSTRLIAIATGVAVALALMGAAAVAPAQASGLTAAQIQSIVSLLASFGADQGTINNVTAALNGQATTGTTSTTSTSGSGAACPALTRDLTIGSTGADVQALQVFLNSSATTQVAASGAGSPGMESTYFGSLTQAAVTKFQDEYGITPDAGYVGAITRAKIASVCGGSTTTTTTTTTTGTTGTAGGAVTISAATQPVNSLAVAGASRVPFTTFTLTNGSNAPVTINSVTVQRTGLGVDTNFSGIVLLDQNGLQVGISHTLNSNHQANIGDNFTLGAGQSVTYTVAGNIQTVAGGNTNNGQVVSLEVVAVNTGATVSGSLPISGASQTINTSLTLGTVSTSTSSYDPGGNQNKSIGNTGVRFTGLRFTAGAAEDLKLYSIRWRQVGTAGSGDISNVVTVVNGTSYPTTVDSTGKYYTTVFPGGILIPKGNSVDVYVQGDLTGNTNNLTVQFNIDKATDVYFVGQLYGYGISPGNANSQPWWTGYITTVQGGSASVIQNATSVASANIPINVPNTILGGFQTNFTGEPVSVSGLTFTVATTSATVGLLTNVSIVDQNGSVVAGPVDATWNSGTETLTFGDTVTFPLGLETYTVQGTIPSGAQNGGTVVLSTTASSNNWINPTGQTTGNTISLPGTTVTMNVQTVKGATLTTSAAPNPVAQSIVAGNGVQLAQIQLDASQSGENIRLNSLPVYFLAANSGSGGLVNGTPGTSGAYVSGLNTCQLWNGSTALNTGTNVLNNSSIVADSGSIGSPTGNATTFTFDNSLTIPKGTVVTLTLACNIASGVQGTVQAGVSTAPSATGVQSGNSLGSNSAVNPTAAGIQSISGTGGTFTVLVDSSSPSRQMVAGGTTGVTLGVLKFHPTSENVNLTKVGLSLASSGNTKSTAAGGTTNSGVNDVTELYLYNGATLVGTAFFTGTNTAATSTLTSSVSLPNNTDTLLTIKGDLANIGFSSSGGIGDVVTVNPANAQGTGASSGTTITVPGSGTTGGVQLFKSYPTVALNSTAAAGINGSNVSLKQFSVTASASGSVGIYQMAFSISTSSASVSNVKLYAYTGSDYQTGPIGTGGGTSGQIGSTLCQNLSCTSGSVLTFTASNTNPAEVGAGQTVYFKLVGTVTQTGTNNNGTVFATLLGTSTAPLGLTTGYNVATSTNAQAFGSSDFIWSDNASTTAQSTDVDWTNAYNVPGLSASGI